jgi:hypothetical protein
VTGTHHTKKRANLRHRRITFTVAGHEPAQAGREKIAGRRGCLCPAIDRSLWQETARDERAAAAGDDPAFAFVICRRATS